MEKLTNLKLKKDQTLLCLELRAVTRLTQGLQERQKRINLLTFPFSFPFAPGASSFLWEHGSIVFTPLIFKDRSTPQPLWSIPGLLTHSKRAHKEKLHATPIRQRRPCGAKAEKWPQRCKIEKINTLTQSRLVIKVIDPSFPCFSEGEKKN